MNDYLLNEFSTFGGYEYQTIVKLHYLTLTILVSFSLGYVLLNKKVYLFKLNQNYSNLSIIIAIILFSLIISVYRIAVVQSVVAISILLFLLIYKSNFSDLKKIILILLMMVILQYLSANYYHSRRDVVKIFLLSFFFISLITNKKKILYALFLIFIFSTTFLVIFGTFLRSPQYIGVNIFDVIDINLKAFIQNYDFVPAFDNLMYIISEDDLKQANSLFKIFYSWIPRDIWSSKPFDTHTLIVSFRKNPFVGGIAQSVTLLGEVYWNFGWISVIFIFFLIGIFAKNFDLIIKKNLKDLTDLQIIFLSSVSYLIFVFWRGSITTTLIIYIINITTIVGTLMILKFFLQKK